MSSSVAATDVPRQGQLRRLASDSGALIAANVLFLLTGIVRTKLAAVFLGPTGLGVIGQLTQLMSLLMTVSVLGMATGIRLVLSRPGLTNEERAQIGKNIVRYTGGVAIALSAAGAVGAAPLARLVLGDPSLASMVRIALVAVPLVLVAQLLVALAQAHGEFRRLTLAAVAAAGATTAITTSLMATRVLALGVLTLPLAALLQLCGLALACPSVRRVARVRRVATWPAVKEIGLVGGYSFVLAAASGIGEAISRGRLVHVGGLSLVAAYQPVALLSSQAYGLVFGAIGTTLLVHLSQSIEQGKDDEVRRWQLSRQLSRVTQRVVVITLLSGLAVQALAGVYIPTLFAIGLMGSAHAVIGQAVPEMFRSVAWTLGAALLPLGMRRAWLASGLSVVAIQTIVLWVLVSHLGVDAVPWAMCVAWGAGLTATVVPLLMRGIRLTPPTWALLAASVSVLAAVWLGSGASRPWSIALLPTAAFAVVAAALTPLAAPRVLGRGSRTHAAV